MSPVLAIVGLASLDEDLKTWAGWAASFSEPPRAWSVVLLFLALAIFVAIQWWEWRLLRTRLETLEAALAAKHDTDVEPAPAPLVLTPAVRELRLPPTDWRGVKLAEVGYAKPRFAAVAVKNEGRRNITGLLPEVWFDGERAPGLGLWCSDPEASFSPIGPEGIALGVGAERLLVLAVRFSGRARAEGAGQSWYAVHSSDSPANYFDPERVVLNGQRLAGRVNLRIRFRAEGVDQSIQVVLASGPDGQPAVRTES